MARTEIALSVRSATLTDDSPGSAMAEVVREVTADTGAPRLAQFVARFDDTVREHLFWQVRWPGNFRAVQETGCPRLHIQFYLDQDQADDDHTVCFQAAILAVVPRGPGGSPPGDGDAMAALDMADGSGGWVGGSVTLDHADPAPRGRLYEISLDLSGHTDGAAAGDYVVIGLRRDSEGTSDTATGDACMVAAGLEYTVR
jgi:hypothetical protein